MMNRPSGPADAARHPAAGTNAASAPQQTPASDTHIAFLDHIRGFAILFVFVFHCMVGAFGVEQLAWNRDGWFRNFDVHLAFLLLFPCTLGWTGVSIFFAVSGFCIHLSHMRSKEKRTSAFLIRRFFRIYPPYLLALLIFSFVPPWRLCPIDSLWNFAQFWSHLLLIHNLDQRSFLGIVPAFWSIGVEFHLYLLLVRRLGWRRTLWVAACVEIGLRVTEGASWALFRASLPGWLTGSPLYFWFSWSMGAAAADALLLRRELPLSKVPAWIFPVLTVIASLVRPASPLAFTFASLSTIPVIAVLLRRPPRRHGVVASLVAGHLRFTGVVSYSAYLVHQPIMVLVATAMAASRLDSHLHPWIKFGLCLSTWAPVLLVAWCFYRWLEMSSIVAGKWVVRKRAERARRAAAAAA
jgi:peptidoglycan/LPS O-acetylase OafA/YrhL